jgi:hypothetical protein
VKLEGIDTAAEDGPALLFGGLDLLDGTPVFDVKPYLSYAESLPEATSGFAREAISRLPVRVAETARAEFESMTARAKAVIQEALSLDPRPATQTGDEEREFGADLCGCNVRFVVSKGICTVFQIEQAEGSGLNI